MLKRCTVLMLVAVSLCAAVLGQEEQRPGEERILPLVLSWKGDAPRFYTTTLHLMSLSNTTTVVVVQAFAGGRQIPFQNDELEDIEGVPVRLRPGEAIRRVLPRLPIPDDGVALRAVWLRLLSPHRGSFAASARVTQITARPTAVTDAADTPSTDEPDHRVIRRVTSDIQVDALPASRHVKAFLAWDGARGCGAVGQSAYAVVNPSREPAEVGVQFVRYLDTGDRVAFQNRIVIDPRTRVNLTLSDLFPGVFAREDGEDVPCHDGRIHASAVLDFHSDSRLAVNALWFNTHTLHFVDLPVRPVRPR